MNTSTIEPPENAAKQGDERIRWLGGVRAKRAVRTVLAVEAVSFLLAATIHAGGIVQGFEHQEAMIAEGGIATVLLIGLAMTWVRPRSMGTIGTIAQGFALVVTLIGIRMIVVGVGPQTVPDVVYHAIIATVLATGLVLTWRARGMEAD